MGQQAARRSHAVGPAGALRASVWHSAAMRARTDDLGPGEKKLLDDVDEYGLHIVHVPEENDGAGFSYSVGLWHNFEQPEVIVFGLSTEVAHELLNLLADEADEGARFTAGTRHDGLLHGYPVRFVEVPKEVYADYLGFATWAYEGGDFAAVQLVWPDKQGRWPWDETARIGFRRAQPVIAHSAPPTA